MKALIKFSAYNASGDKVYIDLEAETPEDALKWYEETASMMQDFGLSPVPGGLEENEKVEEVIGYVLTKNSKGEPVVNLYSVNPKLLYRICPVWMEQFDDLWFTPDTSQRPWLGSPPDRNQAQQEGYMNVFDAPVKIVMKKIPKGDGSEHTWRYERPYDAPKAQSGGGSLTQEAMNLGGEPRREPELRLVTPPLDDESLAHLHAKPYKQTGKPLRENFFQAVNTIKHARMTEEDANNEAWREWWVRQYILAKETIDDTKTAAKMANDKYVSYKKENL